MIKSLKLILILSLAIVCAQADLQLKFVFEMFRHGARGPLRNYYDGWNQSYTSGELLSSGMRQHYYLGQQLRKEYIIDKQFLSPYLNWTEIYIRSDNKNRTLQSANAHFYGFFPIGTGYKIPEGIDTDLLLPPFEGIQYQDIGEGALPEFYQPIPVHSVDLNYDTIQNAIDTCKNASNILNDWYTQHKDESQFLYTDFQSTASQLGALINDPGLTVDEIQYVQSVFQSDMAENRPIPNVSAELWNNMTFVNSFSNYFNLSSYTFTRLMNNNLFTMWIKLFDNVISNKNNGLKWYTLSSHDTNLQYVEKALNITNSQCIYDMFYSNHSYSLQCQTQRPQYASNILVELYQSSEDSQYYVKAKLDGNYVYLCEQYNTTCSYTEFRSRLQAQTYNQTYYEQLCGNSQSEFYSKEHKERIYDYSEMRNQNF